jgi:hypothetical protein
MKAKAYVDSWLSRNKWILVAVGLPMAVAAWWAFRPEKLWINERASAIRFEHRSPTTLHRTVGG